MEIPDIEQARSALTTPERLGELACHHDEEVRRAVASNANTPTETLLALAERFPEEAGNNPVLPLLMLEHPGLLSSMTTTARAALLSRAALPPGLLAGFASPGQPLDVRCAAARNPALPLEALRSLAAPRNILALRLAAASNPAMPAADLEALSRSKVELVRAAAARHPSLPADSRARLSGDRDPVVRAAARGDTHQGRR